MLLKESVSRFNSLFMKIRFHIKRCEYKVSFIFIKFIYIVLTALHERIKFKKCKKKKTPKGFSIFDWS